MSIRRCWLGVALLCLTLSRTVRAQDLPFGISLPPSLNFATSPAPVGSGARAAGKAFAFIAVADDATAASHNPGGLVQLERPEVSIVGSYFIRFEDQTVTAPNTIVEGQTLDSFNLNYFSLAYPFQLLRRNVVVSLNVQRLFDLRGATDVASRFETIDGIQQVDSNQTGSLFTISPAVAVQITPTFSAGVAFNIWPDLFDNGWDQEVTVQGEGRLVLGPSLVPFRSQGRINDDFDFEGFNVTVGFLWSINTVFSVGGVFRSPFTATVTRTHSSSLTAALATDPDNPVTTADSFRETLDMDMPLSYGLGLSARLSDRWTLSLDVSRVHWSDFAFELDASSRADLIRVDNGAPTGRGTGVFNGESDDTMSVRVGAEYLWIRRHIVLPVRAGFLYDPEPSDGGTDDFVGFSLGSGITAGSFLLDMAYTFRTGKVEGEAAETTVYQHTFLASVIYHF